MNGEEVRRRRKALGMSQDTLARELQVTRQSVHMWERDHTKAPALLDLALRALEYERGAIALDVEPAELVKDGRDD